MNKLTLLANGCSMCYGSGLFEDLKTKLCFDNNARFSASWPGILGKELGFNKIVNLGYPGSSNDRILRTTIAWILENWISKSQPIDSLFVVIGWSGPMRREFYINEEWRQLIPYHDYQETSASLLNRVYREVAWSEYESAIRFATQLIGLQSILKFYRISYLFFDAITSITRTNIDAENALNIYLPHIDQHRYYNFLDEKGDMATQVGDNTHINLRAHPNEVGHALWGHKLARFVRDSLLFPIVNEKTTLIPEPCIFEGTGTVKISDRKIGISSKPSDSKEINKLKSLNYELIKNNKDCPKGFLAKLKKFYHQDPFIYE